MLLDVSANRELEAKVAACCQSDNVFFALIRQALRPASLHGILHIKKKKKKHVKTQIHNYQCIHKHAAKRWRFLLAAGPSDRLHAGVGGAESCFSSYFLSASH